MRWNEEIDASCDPGLSADEAVAFEAEDHLMDRRRSDAKMALHVSFSRSLPEHALIDTNESQIAALLFSEAMWRAAARSA